MVFTWCGLNLTILCKDAFWSDTDAFWYWKPLTLILVLKFKHSTHSLTWKKKIKRKEHTPHCKLLRGYMEADNYQTKPETHTEHTQELFQCPLCAFVFIFPPINFMYVENLFMPPCSLTLGHYFWRPSDRCPVCPVLPHQAAGKVPTPNSLLVSLLLKHSVHPGIGPMAALVGSCCLSLLNHQPVCYGL